MPIYEYTCRKCKAHVEIMQKITDKPLTRCRKCGGRLEKEWSQTSFQLKGAGWYVTDYARKKSDAKEAPGAKEKKGEAKTDGAGEKGGKTPAASAAASSSTPTSGD